jgi:CubicO group peptidase (beta-lactamase class C family)
MKSLDAVLRPHVDSGAFPGVVAAVARSGGTETAAVGRMGAEPGAAPMAEDALFRIASVTKPVTAAALLMLVDEGRAALGDPIGRWLPELAGPRVVRTPSSPVDDVVPAERPVTVEDLLTFRAGWGFGADFSLPALAPLFEVLHQGPPAPEKVPPPAKWAAALGAIPMLHQPGTAWLYNTCSDIQGLLISRITGTPFPDFLAERLFGPLGMTGTGFAAPAAETGRLPRSYRPVPADPGPGLEPTDRPEDPRTRTPAFPSGASGLVSTAADLLAFGRMLLADGTAPGGGRLLAPGTVRRMTTDRLTPSQRAESRIFLDGQGWGYGGSVDVDRAEPWNTPGRYGWIGGSGTAWHIVPGRGLVTVLLTQVELTDPSPTPLMRDFWRYAAQ